MGAGGRGGRVRYDVWILGGEGWGGGVGEGSAPKWGFVVWVVADVWVGWGDILG